MEWSNFFTAAVIMLFGGLFLILLAEPISKRLRSVGAERFQSHPAVLRYSGLIFTVVSIFLIAMAVVVG